MCGSGATHLAVAGRVIVLIMNRHSLEFSPCGPSGDYLKNLFSNKSLGVHPRVGVGGLFL